MAKHAIAFGGRDKDFLVRDSSDRLDDRHGVIETFHVDLLLAINLFASGILDASTCHKIDNLIGRQHAAERDRSAL